MLQATSLQSIKHNTSTDINPGEENLAPQKFDPSRSLACAKIYVSTFHATIHPRTLLRRKQICNLKKYEQTGKPVPQHEIMRDETGRYLEALALLELSRGRLVERQREHVPRGELDHSTRRSSRHAGIAHQHDAEAAHFARWTCRLWQPLRE